MALYESLDYNFQKTSAFIVYSQTTYVNSLAHQTKVCELHYIEFMETAVLIAIISGLGSGILSSVLTSIVAPRINSYIEAQNRKKETLNKALHILLEVYFDVRKTFNLNIKQYFDLIEQKLIDKKVEKGKARLLSQQVFPMIIKMLEPKFAEIYPSKEDSISEKISPVISDLSCIEPILAYRISQRHKISPLKNIESFLGEIPTVLNIEVKPDEAEMIHSLALNAKKDAASELLADLQQDIKDIAKRLGRKDLKKVEKFFDETETNSQEYAKELVNKLFSYLPDDAFDVSVSEPK